MISETHNIDCMEFMRGIPDNYFNLSVCDIPYGIDVANMAFLREVKTTVKQKNGTRLNGNSNKKVHSFKDWDKQPPTQEYFDELKRTSRHQIIFGVEYVNWHGLGTGRIKWNKGFAEGMSFKKYELAYCSMIDYEIELPLLWAGMCQAKSLSEPMTQQGNKKLNEKRIHPCHKPILIYDWIFEKYAKQHNCVHKHTKEYKWLCSDCKDIPNFRVFDSHLGSQSSRIAAYKAGLDFVGCELDKEYFEQGNKRFEDFKIQFEQEIGKEKVLNNQHRLF